MTWYNPWTWKKKEPEHMKVKREYQAIVKQYGANSPEAMDYLHVIQEEQAAQMQQLMDVFQDEMDVDEELGLDAKLAREIDEEIDREIEAAEPYRYSDIEIDKLIDDESEDTGVNYSS